jgi:murein DD-endopeptidase MepM/ murein hydrolase activator NlpD
MEKEGDCVGKLWEPGEIYNIQRGSRKPKSPYDKKKPKQHWKKILWQSGISLLIFLFIWGIFQLETPFAKPVQAKIRGWFSEDYNITPVIKFFNEVGLWGDTFERAAFEASKFSENPGLLSIPVSGQISKPFGWLMEVGNSDSFHDGIVITTAKGTPIRSAMAGIVTRLANEEKNGRVVEIKSQGGLVFTYGHCEEILVNLNDEVTRGQVIARVGNTGEALEYQLYFRITKDGEALDPAQLFIPNAEKI